MDQDSPYVSDIENNTSKDLTSIDSQKHQKRKRTLRVFTVLLVVTIAFSSIIAVSLYVWKYLINKDTDVTEGEENTEVDTGVVKTQTAEKFVVGFRKGVAGTTEEVVLYDITNDTVLSSYSEVDVGTAIGKWSPEGSYLPIQYVSQGYSPLHFYDAYNNDVLKVIDIDDTRNSEINLASYLTISTLMSNWLDDDTYIYYNDGLDKTLYLIDINGEIKKESGSEFSTYFNERLEFKTEINISNEGVYEEDIIEIKIDEDIAEIDPIGQIIGVVDNLLVTLEKLELSDLYIMGVLEEIEEDYDFDNMTEEELREIVEEFLSTQEESKLYLYSVDNIDSTPQSISIGNEGWYAIDAKIRPVYNTIIVLLYDSVFPEKAKYIEIDPNNTNLISTIVEIKVSEVPRSGFIYEFPAFGITLDGRWVIGYAYSEQSESYQNLVGTIKAWDLIEGKERILCEDICSYLRVYNPNDLWRY